MKEAIVSCGGSITPGDSAWEEIETARWEIEYAGSICSGKFLEILSFIENRECLGQIMASGTIDDPETQEILDVLSPPGDGVKRFLSSGDAVAGTQWYVLSMSWLYRWRVSRGLEPGPAPEPGEIDNSDVLLSPDSFYASLSSEDYRNFIVRPGLTLNVDYVLVSNKAWKVLKQKFGVKGPTIVRYSISADKRESNTCVEVLLKPVLVSIIPKRDKPAVLAPLKPIYVSKRDDQNRLKERLIDIYNKTICQGASKASLIYSALWKLDPSVDLDDLQKQLEERKEPMESPGELLPKETQIDACNIASDDVVLLELWVRLR